MPRIYSSPLSYFGPNGPPDAKTQITMQIGFMQSPDILTPIIQDLKLAQIWAKRFKSDHDVMTQQEALDHLRKVLKIEAVTGTNIVKVTASSQMPQEAADIANTLIDHYKAYSDQHEVERFERGADVMRDQITQQEKVVNDAKSAAAKLRQDDNAQRWLEQQQSLHDALNARLKQDIADHRLQESRVRIISRAVAPPE